MAPAMHDEGWSLRDNTPRPKPGSEGSLPDVEALIIVNRGDGTLSEYATPWFVTLEKPANDSG